jgi:hypothetical protein
LRSYIIAYLKRELIFANCIINIVLWGRKPGCKMLELWDLDDQGKMKAEGKRPVCPKLFRGDAHPFHRVYENRSYVVLQLNYTKYIEFMPNNLLYTA